MKGQTNHYVLAHRLQRQLRNDPTDAEKVLWRHLRARQLGGSKFRRQHPYGDFILDLVCIEAKLVIEVDGGQHIENAGDRQRDAFLAQAGFQVLRFWDNEVLQETDSVLERILLALSLPHPPSNSPLEGGRVDAFPPLQGEGKGGDGSPALPAQTHPAET
jgi:very-short-patch-repair endonuclease